MSAHIVARCTFALAVCLFASLGSHCQADVVLESKPFTENDVENMLIGELVKVVDKDKPFALEDGLRRTFATLPKNAEGNLGHAAVRYVMHRVFMHRHGWFIKGLESDGSASDWVPAHLQKQVEKRMGEHGVNLRELAALGAALEGLVRKEAAGRLEAVYKMLELSTKDRIDQAQVKRVLETYMMGYLSGASVSAASPQDADQKRQEFIETYDAWDAVEKWLVKIQRKVAKPDSATQGFSFAQTRRMAESIGEEFGHFNDLECSDLKATMLRMEGPKAGRVLLSDFYKKSLYSHWNFSEKVDYLRVLGALDESDPKRPHVLVPNYLMARPNCLEATNLYSVCCRNECEDLMGHLEHEIASPFAEPKKIVELVSKLSSDTVKAPRQLSESMVQRLNQVADANGGKVPMNGRLFAQWMHHAYPRECPYPHEAGSTNPQTAEEWMAESGHTDHQMTDAEMKDHVEACEADGPHDHNDELPWSEKEELLAHHAHEPSVARSAPQSADNETQFMSMRLIGAIALAALVAGLVYWHAGRWQELVAPGRGKAFDLDGRPVQASPTGLQLVLAVLALAALVAGAYAVGLLDEQLLLMGLFFGVAAVVVPRVVSGNSGKSAKCFQ